MRRAVASFVLAIAGSATLPLGAADVRTGTCGTYRGITQDALWAHREAGVRSERVRVSSASRRADVGNIAVIQDEGDLLLGRNPLDLQGAGLDFRPVEGGYSVTRVDRALGADTGTRLSLTDDSSQAVPLPFAFSFYGKTYTEVFVNSDGNLTFGQAESSSAARSLSRLVNGPPRIAPLFADLDPGVAGSVTARPEADRFVVAWTEVPQYGLRDKNSFQVTLWADGRVDFTYGRDLTRTLQEGVVGIAPGNAEGGLTPVDFATSGAASAGALAEGFRAQEEFDIVAMAQKFYRTHGDDYEQIIVFTNRPVGGLRNGYFAFELGIKNLDTGIGEDIEDYSAAFGSGGRLESFVMMEYVGKYPTNLDQTTLGNVSALSILGQEVGHRWGARAVFKDGDKVSDELLGRDGAHWSFYVDTDGSHLEGNEIQDLGGGQFRTGTPGVAYSPLDQYLMGIRPPEEIPPFFLIRTGGPPSGQGPEANVTISGTRKDVTIGDIIAAMGERNPPAGPRPPYRQAFIFVSVGEPPDPTRIERVEQFRATWESFFAKSVEGRWAVDTRLAQ